MSVQYRVGTKLGRTVYRDEHLIGMFDTAADAALAVQALNGDAAAIAQRADGSHDAWVADQTRRETLAWVIDLFAQVSR